MRMKTLVRILFRDRAGQVYHIDVTFGLGTTMQYLIPREVGQWVREAENLTKQGVDIRGLTLYGFKVVKQVKETGERLDCEFVAEGKTSPLVSRGLPYVSR